MIDDTKLIAYVDGELDARGRAEVEAALAVDPLLATRLARHRDLRTRLSQAYDPVALEAVPERLRRAASGGRNNIVRLADRRNPPKPRRLPAWHWPSWTPIAATLVLGLVGGYVAAQGGSGPLAARSDGALAVRGDLARALDRQPSGEAGPIRVGLSFRSADGYCRTFEMASRRLAGVACREPPGWVARMTTAMPAHASPGPAYRMAASSTPPAVLTAVGDMMVGRSLDRAEEDAARKGGWRK